MVYNQVVGNLKAENVFFYNCHESDHVWSQTNHLNIYKIASFFGPEWVIKLFRYSLWSSNCYINFCMVSVRRIRSLPTDVQNNLIINLCHNNIKSNLDKQNIITRVFPSIVIYVHVYLRENTSVVVVIV